EDAVDGFHALPYVLRQTAGGIGSVEFTIAEASRQRLELLRCFFRQYQIACVTTNDPQRVDEVSQEQIRRLQNPVLRFCDDFEPAQLLQRLQSVWNSQVTMSVPMKDLQ